MENLSKDEVQLISRHWKIADAQGSIKEVKGPGVVGEQPVLKPGTAFEYTSGTLLPTSSGIMMGSYQMVTTAGEPFEVEIPAFSLDVPGEKYLRH
jgi:ApaG protein